MFKKSEMYPVAKRNLRYRILKTKDSEDYYLLDVEPPFFIVYFLPLFIYFVPHRCYPLSQEEYDELSKTEEENKEYKSWIKNQTSLGRNVGIGVGTMLLAGVFDINQYLNFDVAEYGNFSKSLTVLILLAVFGLRVWLTRAYKLPEILRNRTYKRLYIFPKSIKSYLGALLCYLFTLFSGGFLVYELLFTNEVNNFIIHFCVLLCSFFSLFGGNMLFFHYVHHYWVKVK